MFGWFKSERRERRKKVRQDREHLEARARRFLKGYLEADQMPYIADADMQQLGTAAVHLLTTATSYTSAQNE